VDAPDGELIPLHTRTYNVLAFRKDASTFVLRGEVEDVKPPGLYVLGDPDPLTVHHMIVDLTITVPDMVIADATVVLETHPHRDCAAIEPHYGQLVGLSIARGFSSKVRELFGGPRGCTHTTALLQAMAPVAIQTTWSMNMLTRRTEAGPGEFTPEQRASVIRSSLNTCHVWAEGSEHHLHIRDGERPGPALPVQVRLRELGLDAPD
jgi:hypothetical protein